MNISDKLHGFTVTNIREIPDTRGTLYEMVHDKTGAQLAWLHREDENKTFTITFKTLPSNDTGVFHILEHSVLNGSRKYPVREPFVELLKGSMQTFLNAFTYPDKTMYPVSSRNNQDFMNLMSVYMDAVFYPQILTNKNIFLQEGWHYEIRDPKDEPVYKGVVLNEMKGAFSSEDECIVNELNRMLFPDNCYKYVSGGDPEHIVELSYEEFLDTRAKFYHPSNARVFLDGNLDIEKVLTFINDEYFDHFEKEDMNFTIANQEVVAPEVHHVSFEVMSEEEMHNRTQIAMAKIMTSFDQLEEIMAWEVLTSVLTANLESPLTNAILSNDLGEDVEFDIYGGIQQPWVFVAVNNTEEEKYDEIMRVLHETADHLIHGGLDHKQIIAALNQMEFRYREKHEPAGVSYAQRAMNSWLYDGDPALYLSQGELFDSLRQKCEEGYFESLLEKFFMGGDMSVVISNPSLEVGPQRVQREQERLHAAKQSWGDEITSYIEENAALDEWQRTPDSEEQLATLPHLSRSDISEEVISIPYSSTRLMGIPVILHPSDDPEIVYLNMFFSLAGIKREELSSVALFSSLFTQLPTKNHSVEELQRTLRENVGSLAFHIDAFSEVDEIDACTPVFIVNCSVLRKKLPEAVKLIQEVLLETQFTADNILPLIRQGYDSIRQSLVNAGNAFALTRATAQVSAEGVFKEFAAGYSFGCYIKQFVKNFDEQIPTFLQECELYREVLFAKSRMTLSVTGKENVEALSDLVLAMSSAGGSRTKVHYPLLETRDEYISIPGGVSYTGVVGSYRDIDVPMDSKRNAAAHILTYDYLWNEVRVKGGAYGTNCRMNPNGSIAFSSYRDPDPVNAMHAYQTAGDHLQKMAREDADIEQMMIGAIAAGDPLLSPAGIVHAADMFYFRKVTDESRQKNRKNLLTTQTSDFMELGEQMKRVLEHVHTVVVCAEEKTKELEGFTELEKL